jgi:hypothetical protein
MEQIKMKPSKVIALQQPVSAFVYTATVISGSSNKWVIDLSGRHCLATVCFSCMVQPRKNDVVMCVVSEAGDYFITGIIERETDHSMLVAFPGDVTMQTDTGSINIVASKSVTMAASDSINCLSDQVLHKSNSAIVNYDNLTASGSSAKIGITSIHIMSELINTIARQVLQKFKTYIRHSEESDHIKTQSMSRQATGVYTLDSQYTIMQSKKDTKIDGEHIHMG